MAVLATQVIPHTGLAPVLGAASAGGDEAPTGDGVFLVVDNGDAASHTVTLAIPETVDGQAVASRDVVVAAGKTAYIPLLDLYKNPATKHASISYDAVTSVTVGVLRLP